MCHMTYVFVCVEVPVHCVSVCPVYPGSLHVSFYGKLIRLCGASGYCTGAVEHTPSYPCTPEIPLRYERMTSVFV